MTQGTSRPQAGPPKTLIALAVAFGYYFVVGLTVALLLVSLFFLRDVPKVAIFFLEGAVVLLVVTGALMILGLTYIAILLWAAWPRWSQRRIDGVSLGRSQQPALWELIDEVAGSCRLRAPRRVRLTLRYELTTDDDGGPFGWLTPPTFRIGLPLLLLHNEAEVRALLAHEIAHITAGDRSPPMRLALRIRESLLRTTRLSQNPALGVFLVPLSFVHIYASFAIRVLNGTVWSQDFAADRLAAKSESAEALAAAVQFSGESSGAWLGFRESALWPMIQLGFRPPIAGGLDRYLESPTAIRLAETAAKESRTAQPTQEIVAQAPDLWRVAAITRDPVGRDGDSPIAGERLTELSGLEDAVVRAHFPFGRTLTAVGWHQVVEQVYLPLWRRGCEANRELLAVHTPYTVAEAVRKILTTSGYVVIPNESQPWFRDPVPFTRWLLGAAICLAGLRTGCTITAWPGEPIRLSRNGNVLEPFDWLLELEQGKLSREEWWRRCAMIGILDTTLGTGEPSATRATTAA